MIYILSALMLFDGKNSVSIATNSNEGSIGEILSINGMSVWEELLSPSIDPYKANTFIIMERTNNRARAVIKDFEYRDDILPVEIDVLYELINGVFHEKYTLRALEDFYLPDSIVLHNKFLSFDYVNFYNHTGEILHIQQNTVIKFVQSYTPHMVVKKNGVYVHIFSNNPSTTENNVYIKNTTLSSSMGLINVFKVIRPNFLPYIIQERKYERDFYVMLNSDSLWMDKYHVYLSPFPYPYKALMSIFLDEIPFEWNKQPFRYPHNEDDTTSPVGRLFIKLLNRHPDMKIGFVLLLDLINDSTDVLNPWERRWWLVQGKSRNLLMAPEDYVEWLERLDRNIVKLGYEHRIHLGLHGLHHTPSDSESNFVPSWEFQYNNPVVCDSTFMRIKYIFLKLGLAWGKPRFYRAPGFRTTAPLLKNLLNNGFIIQDYMIRKDIYSNFMMHVYYGERDLWLIQSKWAGDKPDSVSVLASHVEKGYFTLLAGHPMLWVWYGDTEKFHIIDSTFTYIEEHYPRTGWMFADDFGLYLSSLDKVELLPYIDEPDRLMIPLSCPKDSITLVIEDRDNVLHLPAYLSNKQLNSYREGDRVFIMLVKTSLDTLVMYKNNDFKNKTCVLNELKIFPFEAKEVIIYDTSGRRVYETSIDAVRTIRLSPGIYFIKYIGEDGESLKKVIIL